MGKGSIPFPIIHFLSQKGENNLKGFDKFCRRLNQVYETAGVVLLVVMAVSLFLQVFTRYALHRSLSGTEELARYTFIWITMVGTSICVMNGGHATVTILNDQLKGNLKKMHQLVIELCMIVCSAVLFRYSCQLLTLTAGSVTPTLRIPMNLIYLSFPVGMVGGILSSINNILHLFAKEDADGAEEQKGEKS